MALPAAFDTITVTGTYVDFLGAPGVGTVTFTPNPAAWLKATASDVVIVPKPRSVTLSASGTFSVVLPVTNDPDVVPTYSYTVKEDVSGFSREQAIEIPVSLRPGPVDLSDLTTTGVLPTGTTALTKTIADTIYTPIRHAGADSRPAGIMVPLYIYPSNVAINTDYNNLIALSRQHRAVPVIAIINPGSGPGTETDANYAAAIKRLRGAGIKVYGYLSTHYAEVPSTQVIADLNTWESLYPTRLDGFFLDEMTNASDDTLVEHYRALTATINARGYPTIANPGANTPEPYFATKTADIVVIHENSFYPSESDLHGDYFGGHADYGTDRRAALVYLKSSLDTTQLSTIVKYVDWVYITSGDLPNPWNTLPSYLGGLFTAVAGINNA